MLRLVVATMLAAVPVAALAQSDYPNRRIKIVVPAPPGPSLDMLSRLIADKLAAHWGQPVIVENRPGAAQNLGAEAVAKAEPDGYTLLATPQGPLVISQHFFPKLGFDPSAFVPVSIFATQPLLLVANPKVRALTLQEFVALAKTSPDRISFASPGTGSSPHLTGEMLKTAADIDFVHVPYKGMAPATADLLAGHVDIMFDNLGNTLPHIKEGKLKVLGVAGETRIPELSDVPAIAEMFPGFYSTSWFAVVAPPKTPADIADKLSQAIAQILRRPDVVERYRAMSGTPVGTSPSETAAFLKKESERWRKVIAAAGIRAK
jgi:tripartite-type tricarboxylate transporter receptor subunit TctC